MSVFIEIISRSNPKDDVNRAIQTKFVLLIRYIILALKIYSVQFTRESCDIGGTCHCVFLFYRVYLSMCSPQVAAVLQYVTCYRLISKILWDSYK